MDSVAKTRWVCGTSPYNLPKGESCEKRQLRQKKSALAQPTLPKGECSTAYDAYLGGLGRVVVNKADGLDHTGILGELVEHAGNDARDLVHEHKVDVGEVVPGPVVGRVDHPTRPGGPPGPALLGRGKNWGGGLLRQSNYTNGRIGGRLDCATSTARVRKAEKCTHPISAWEQPQTRVHKAGKHSAHDKASIQQTYQPGWGRQRHIHEVVFAKLE